MQEQIRAAETASRKHKNLIVQIEAERELLREQAENEAAVILKNSRKLVEQTIAEIRQENASKVAVRSAFSRLEQAQKELKAYQRKSSEKRTVRAPKLQMGDKVRVKSLNQFGEIVSVSAGKTPLDVKIGAMRMRVSSQEVEPVSPEENKRKLSPSVLEVQYSKLGAVKTELNLQGQTVYEATEKTDKYLDDASLAGLPSIRIIHGKGTGALRAAIHELLRDHPLVAQFKLAPQNEGGDGATIVTLRD